MTEIKIFQTPEETVAALANKIISLSSEAIKKDGRFLIALSGGNTPKKLFELLATEAYRKKINWHKTWIAWSDERYVPQNNPESNVGMAMNALIKHIPVPESQILIPDTSLEPEVSALHYETLIKSTINEGASFHLILLGLGSDGHTASLFPGTDILTEKSALVKSVFVPQKDTYRLSFTAKLINQAKNVAFLVTGNEKANILEHLLNHKLPPYPARLIHPAEGKLFWYLDSDAASMLQKED